MYELFVRNINIIRQHFLSVSTDYLANSLDLGVLLVYLWVVCWDFPEFVRAGNFVLITLIITLRKKQNIQKHKKPTKPTLGWIFVCPPPRNGLLNFFSSDKILSIPTSRVVLLMCLHSLLRYRVFRRPSKLSTQCECTVTPTLAGNLFYNQQQPSGDEGEVANF